MLTDSPTLDKAAFGPKVASAVYALTSLVDGIEGGPHNVTRWWVLGREMPAPSGNDKTSLLVSTSDEDFGQLLKGFVEAGVKILTVYERPSKKTLDTHRYVLEVEGHAGEGDLAVFLAKKDAVRVLGSYPRK